jgi:hypothetical protein
VSVIIGSGLGTATLMGLWVIALLPRTDGFVVENAEYGGERSKLGPLGPYHVTAHRLESGRGAVIALREYEPSFDFDAQIYSKLTIHFPRGLPNDTHEYDVGSGEARVIFSEGGSAWPEAGCHGTGRSGTIRYVPLGFGWAKVEIDSNIATDDRFGSKRCGSLRVHRRQFVRQRELSSLTPWEGRPGSYIYDETYP